MPWWDSHETQKIEQWVEWCAKVLAGAGLAVLSRALQKWLAKRALPDKLVAQLLCTTDDQNSKTLRGIVEQTATQMRIHTELKKESEKNTEARFTEVSNNIKALRDDMTRSIKELRDEANQHDERQDERIDRLLTELTKGPK